jgi:hypothetical protein
VGSVFYFDDGAGHALRWKIKRNSNGAAALLRSAAASGLPLNLATIWLIDA